jgi:hypothetical protein
MELRENPVFGRKIFFLNPTFALQNSLIAKLIEDEFETYVIKDYRDTKNILREFPDSICFINIDDQLPYHQWFNFIQSFETDSTLKSIFLGVLSERISRSDRELFMLKLSIPAGFIMMNERMEDIITTIEGILKINGAKGRRQYVRADCADDPSALLLLQQGTKVYKFHLLNISVVGTACEIPAVIKNIFQKNTVLRNISITLGQKTFACSAAVYTIINLEENSKLVLLFMQIVPFTTKKIIRGYIAAERQRIITDIAQSNSQDMTDYSEQNTDERPGRQSEAFLVEVDDEEIQQQSETVSLQEKSQKSSAASQKYNGSAEDLSMTHLF